ncbi:hypothetical protein ACFLZB_02485 [Nanoarchaeota archaeon]
MEFAQEEKLEKRVLSAKGPALKEEKKNKDQTEKEADKEYGVKKQSLFGFYV